MKKTTCSRINRIRLEFKDRHIISVMPIDSCINRIRLEFKVGASLYVADPEHLVLIESDWNLKVLLPGPF